MIGSHSRAESVGELVHLPMDMALDRQCTCGKSMHACPLWPQVMERMGVSPGVSPYALKLGYAIANEGDDKRTSLLHRIVTRPKNALVYIQLRYGLTALQPLTPGFREGIQNTQAIYDIVRQLAGKDVIVDSSKHYLRAVGLYRQRPQTTRIVLLVRDGRAVFYSCVKRGLPRSYALRSWYSHYRRALPLIEQHVPAQNWCVVRYEQLLADPPAALAALCGFVGLAYEDRMLNAAAVVHHNINGNNDMKFRFASDAKLTLDEAWKEKLGADDLRYFLRHAGALNRKMGYS